MLLLLYLAASVLSLTAAQTQIQPVDVIIVIDDSFGVTNDEWNCSMEFLKNLVRGTSRLIEASTWQLGVITFSSRIIMPLSPKGNDKNQGTMFKQIDDANYMEIPATSNIALSAVTRELATNGRNGVASVILMMPSRSLQYNNIAFQQWRQSMKADFNSFMLVVGLNLDAAQVSFFSVVAEEPEFFQETQCRSLATTQNVILEKLYKATGLAIIPDSPDDCVPMDLVFVIDQTASQFIPDIKLFINGILKAITNLGVSEVQVAAVLAGNPGNILFDVFAMGDYSDPEVIIDNINFAQSARSNLGDGLRFVNDVFVDQRTLFDRSVENDVIVFITYREPDISTLENAIRQYRLSAARFIALGVETSENTLNTIATVPAWKTIVPSFNDLQSLAYSTSRQICSAAIPVCFYSADVAIVIDAGSFQAVNNWEMIRSLVKDIVRSYFYGFNGVRFAIVVYGSDATLSYNLDASRGSGYPRLEQFASEIESLSPLSRTAVTRPAEAFRIVREQVFSTSNSGNRVSDRNVVLWVPSSVTSDMQQALNAEVQRFQEMSIAVGVVGIQLNSEGMAIAQDFTSSIASNDLSYFISDTDSVSIEQSRVRLIYNEIDPLICRVYKTDFQDVQLGEQGDTGATGLVGMKGSPGARGRLGDNGQSGNPGSQGVGGVAGFAGSKGQIGLNGQRGQQGNPGGPGSPGINGAVGPAGNNGSPGQNGQRGQKGSQGMDAPGQGEDGDPGFGAPGSPGARGSAGNAGNKGQIGQPGQNGERGQFGITGNKGQQGLFGDRGINGGPGGPGARGQLGEPGPAGDNAFGGPGNKGSRGEDGTPGSNGRNGSPGSQGVKGLRGSNGSPGFNGDKGSDGDTGFNGVPGSNGSPGLQGDAGSPAFGDGGIAGEKGNSGAEGFPGPNGLAGSNGSPGSKGQQGTNGRSGIDGANGAAGAKGMLGETGASGNAGPKGVANQGSVGQKGSSGGSGATGNSGTRGQPGGTGNKGSGGIPGTTGSTGATGRFGSAGAAGQKGFVGPAGPNGQPGQSFVGQDGQKGFAGHPGTPGTSGNRGQNGSPGTPGSKGDQGNSGFNGNNGNPGSQGLEGNRGSFGNPGQQGSQGDPGRGFPGSVGTNGLPGSPGQRGNSGPQGFVGNPGDNGFAGFDGQNGSPGSPGDSGDRGNPGFPGSPGPKGTRGFTGATGFNGDLGNRGQAGGRGPIGVEGNPGTSGFSGQQGPKGLSGGSVRGEKGSAGVRGPRGPTGPPGPGGVVYVDECQSFNPCSQLCVDTYDSYYCACQDGYELVDQITECPLPQTRRKKRQVLNPQCCQTNDLDVVLLLDNSAWITQLERFQSAVVAFLSQTGYCDSPKNMRVAIVLFGSSTSVEYSFSDQQSFTAVKQALANIALSQTYDFNPEQALIRVSELTASSGQLAPRGNSQLVVAMFTSFGFYSFQQGAFAASTAIQTRSNNPAIVFAFGVSYASEQDVSGVATSQTGNDVFYVVEANFNEFATAVSDIMSGNTNFQSSVCPVPPTQAPPTPGPPGTNEGECFGADLDIALVLDVSWWVGSIADYASAINQFIDSIPSCSTESIRFAVISFAVDGRLELALTQNVASVKSTVAGLENRGEWVSNLGSALTLAENPVFAQSSADTEKVIFIASGYNQDEVTDQVQGLQRRYTVAAYGFKRGAENPGWLSVVSSDPTLSFVAPNPNDMTLPNDMVPFVDNLRTYMDIQPPSPVGPDPLDLVIILDASGSVDADFNNMKNFAKDVIQNLNVSFSNVRIGLVRFSQTASASFALSRYTSLDEVERAIDQVARIGGRTNIAASLRVTNQMFETQGRPDVPWVALLISDGYANEEVGRTVYDASVLRSTGVHVIGVQVTDVRGTLMRQSVAFESIATGWEYVYKFGSYVELSSVLRIISVQRGVSQLAYVEYDPPIQPERYFCRDTCHGLMCFCREGPYRPTNGTVCNDIDECGSNNGGCEQVCENSQGGFACTCNNGYELSDDGTSCLDVDECQGNQVCTANTKCINYVGGFICVDSANTDPSTGAMIGGAVVPLSVSPGVVVAISLSAALGTVGIAVAIALAGRTLYKRNATSKGEQDEPEENPRPSALNGTDAYGTVRSKLSMAHSENKAVL